MLYFFLNTKNAYTCVCVSIFYFAMYLIYCHVNKINGKRYVGYTSYTHNPNRRWRDGLGYLNGHHKIFASAILKYGWDNFEHIILENNIITAKEAKIKSKTSEARAERRGKLADKADK